MPTIFENGTNTAPRALDAEAIDSAFRTWDQTVVPVLDRETQTFAAWDGPLSLDDACARLDQAPSHQHTLRYTWRTIVVNHWRDALRKRGGAVRHERVIQQGERLRHAGRVRAAHRGDRGHRRRGAHHRAGAGGGGELVRLGCAIEIAEQRSAGDMRGLCLRIDGDAMIPIPIEHIAVNCGEREFAMRADLAANRRCWRSAGITVAHGESLQAQAQERMALEPQRSGEAP